MVVVLFTIITANDVPIIEPANTSVEWCILSVILVNAVYHADINMANWITTHATLFL